MILQFPVDYMHCACLSVMRKLLFLWRNGSRLYRININEFEEYIMHIKRYWPQKFNRKPRSINQLGRWKATELRQFLLYMGPVILKNMLHYHVYSNFVLLKYAITILLNHELNVQYNEYARSYCRYLYAHSVHIYGKDFGVCNTLVLIPLADDVRNFKYTSEALLEVRASDILFKGVVIPLDDQKMVFFPLIHLNISLFYYPSIIYIHW